MISVGTTELERRGPQARGTLEAALDLARREAPTQIPRALNNLALFAVAHRSHELAEQYIEAGLAYCAELELDLWRLSILSGRVRSELDRGLWSAAAETARILADDPFDSPGPKLAGLLTMGLVRARRGDPDADGPIAAATEIDFPDDELFWPGPVAVARAEIAWLEGRSAEIGGLTETAYELARRGRAAWPIGELAYWRRKAGIDEPAPEGAAEPYALQLAGDWRGASAAWTELGCPYDAALALSEGDVRALRRALEECHRLGEQKPCPAHGAGNGGITPRLRGAEERRYRGAALRVAQDGRSPRLGGAPEAGRSHARRGRRGSRAPGPARGSLIFGHGASATL